ncbi:GNAT family N-acetyltransferase [Bacillus sp. M6-12]|nr:GNAT family N-acetyltransferase [Bacillus sp. M6-12]
MLDNDIAHLILESKQEGFRFVQRLKDEYYSGENIFNKPGEALYGVVDAEGTLIAVGGLNIDPLSSEHGVCRLRRFYVARACRRNGIGRLLLEEIIKHAREHFQVMVLNTDTEQADSFYSRRGFTKEKVTPKSSHYLRLSNG